MNWNNTIFDPHDEGRYGSLEIGVATSQKPGLMSTADKAALGAASAASAEIPQIKQTLENLKNGPTLFAYEKVSGKFVIGYITNNTMFVHTDGDDLLVADADGALSSLAYTNDDLKAIQSAVNEHFETSTFGITAIQSSFAIGDTVPNWNAYEKIMLPPIIYAKITPQGSSLWTIGKILGNTFKILCQNDEGAWQVTNDGKINGVFGHPDDLMSYMWAPKLQQAGYEISAFEIELVAYNVGDTIDNWNDFIDIS